jgi:hypothetical protein
MINASSLSDFESKRYNSSFIPDMGSNTFYDIKLGNNIGRINIWTIRDNVNDYRFDLYIDEGIIYSGSNIFYISGDIIDNTKPYNTLTVLEGTTLIIDKELHVNGGELHVYGNLIINGRLSIYDIGKLILYSNSSITFNTGSILSISDGSTGTIYGTINLNLTYMNILLGIKNLSIDSSASISLMSSDDDTNRIFSLSNYFQELRETYANINTVGDRDTTTGSMKYIWRAGNPLEPSQVLGLVIQVGDIPLGDLRFNVLGISRTSSRGMNQISDIYVNKNAVLHVTEKYMDSSYIMPELYIGINMNTDMLYSGKCIVDGKIICNGINSRIIIDRGGSLTINEGGEVHILNESKIVSAYNFTNPVLVINGKLYVDDVSMFSGFEPENISIGENGKIIIVNPTGTSKRVLFTTPNGIKSSELYRLFLGRLDKVEYHISANTGIGIDDYYEFYSLNMREWYNGMRFERAIKDGYIIWHDGAFIELYEDITPWANQNCNLYNIGDLFKAFGSFVEERLQDVVNRLTYAKCGDILFRIICRNGTVREFTLRTEGINMKSIVSDPIHHRYRLTTDNDGQLYIKRLKSTVVNINSIIDNSSMVVDIDDQHRVDFYLPIE